MNVGFYSPPKSGSYEAIDILLRDLKERLDSFDSRMLDLEELLRQIDERLQRIEEEIEC